MKLTLSLGDRVYVLEHPGFCGGYPIYSGLFVCPICTKTWACAISENSNFFEPRAVSCERCKYKDMLRQVPGSILDNANIHPGAFDWELLEVLPQELLVREFNLTLEAYSI